MKRMSRNSVDYSAAQRRTRCSADSRICGSRGFTLIELVITCSILIVLATVALPLERVRIVHGREDLLRRNLREIRDAIDQYHDDAEKGKFQVEAGTENYPPDLQTLVDGVQVTLQQPIGQPAGAQSTSNAFGQSTSGAFGQQSSGSTTTPGPTTSSGQKEKVRYLRKIPIDPMTGDTDWGLRSVQDDPDATSWGGQDVFDVYSKSQGTALDGTKYSDW
jgi:general secretion pathway protein G